MRVVSPTIDDEFAKGFDFDDLDSLKTELRKRIGEEKVQGNKNRIEQTILETILKENSFEVPASMIEDQKQFLMNQAAQSLKERGLEEEAIKAEVEKHENDAATEAEQRVKVFFILEAIAQNEKIFVTETDVDAEFRTIAAGNQMSPQDVRKHYEDNKLLDDLRWGVRERKVRDFLRENAKITDK